MRFVHGTSTKQRGVALMVGLVLLLVLTLIGVSAMRSAVLEERMTGNTQDLQIAFQFAEAALREGEMVLMQPSLPVFANDEGLYIHAPPTAFSYVPLWQDPATEWIDAEIDGDDALGLARAQYIIEEMLVTSEAAPGESLQADTEAPNRTVIVYRITARAWGASGANNPTPMVMLQSTFQR
jgi:type IV pilus assembly protein PilX